MRGHQKQFHCQSPMEWSWTDHGRGPVGTEPVQLELQGSNHTWEWCGIVCNLAAKLFACKLCDIIEMAWLNADHNILLSSFQFVFVFVYKHKFTTKDGSCRGLTKARGLGLGTWQAVEQRRVTWRSAMDSC